MFYKYILEQSSDLQMTTIDKRGLKIYRYILKTSNLINVTKILEILLAAGAHIETSESL